MRMQIVLTWDPDAPPQNRLVINLPAEAPQDESVFLRCQAIVARAAFLLTASAPPAPTGNVVLAQGPIPPLVPPKGGRN